MTGDAEVKRLAELRQRWLRDELRMKELVENAKNDLKRAKRINKIEIVKVREESLKQTSLQIAKNMLNKNINLDTIIECTKLSREEILNLK